MNVCPGAPGAELQVGLRSRAAQYLRMSTEHQRYSTENQADAIAAYASARSMDVVRTYADHGKSGLTLRGRPGLAQLIADAAAGATDCTAVLVYDLSRWGRFQDADESAHYEFLCRQAGLSVHYCAEPFDNDGGVTSSLLKNIKRVMAAEYSRDLATKVRAGHRRLVAKGYRQGGPAGTGLRRWLTDPSGAPRLELSVHARKNLQSERVVLRPGPPAEIALVRRIYAMFVGDGLRVHEIVKVLGQEGCQTDLGRLWTSFTVREVLTNEKYIGNLVYGKTASPLKSRPVAQAPGTWARIEGAFEPIVPRKLFDAAAATFAARSKFGDEDFMLQRLADLFASTGYLSVPLLKTAKLTPTASAYRYRFGTLAEAYRRVGYVKPSNFRDVDARRATRVRHRQIIAALTQALAASDSGISADAACDVITAANGLTLSLVVASRGRTPAGKPQWIFRLHPKNQSDLTVVVLPSGCGASVAGYLLIPQAAVAGRTLTRMVEGHGRAFHGFRHKELVDLLAAIGEAP